MEEGEEVASGFVVAGGDAAALLEPRVQTFDVVAFAVLLPVVRALDFTVALRRNDRLASLVVDDPGLFPVSKSGAVESRIVSRRDVRLT